MIPDLRGFTTTATGERANKDIQLIIYQYGCVVQLAKYASNSEKIPSVAREAFILVMKNVSVM